MMKSTNLRAHFIISLILLTAVSAPAQQPTPQTREDTISGRVVNDSAQPIAGVNISLGSLGGPLGQRTSTDNEGNFKIKGLDGGIYRFYIYAPGYVTLGPTSDTPTYRPGDKVELTMMKGAVITGRVTNMSGEPAVTVQVRAFQVRDADGNKVQTGYYAQPVFTDDRGIFRMWSLRPGTYVVAAGGQGQYFGAVNPFANDAMTYAPASTRDTAAEIIARSNQEATVDIQYRGERGHAISGRIAGAMPSPPYSPGVSLFDVDTHTQVANLYLPGSDGTFQLNGVADGEYEIVATGGAQAGQLSSALRRIVVRGADVTGIELSLAPMASVDAHVSLEADQKLNCGRRRETALRETMVTLRRSRPEENSANKKEKPAESFDPFSMSVYEMAPNAKSDVRFLNLYAASYRFEVRLPAAGWYLKDLSLAKPESNIARNGLAIKPGEIVSGVTIRITEGGASLRGRVAVAEDSRLPPDLRIYIVPAERPDGDNPLRFFEDAVASDGTFVIGNIAPGRYWLLARPAEPIDEKTMKSPRVDNDFRAKLLKEAAAANKEIAFKPCERTVDYEFRYPSK
jgi:Carboxypeptidase regulatory-like domain